MFNSLPPPAFNQNPNSSQTDVQTALNQGGGGVLLSSAVQARRSFLSSPSGKPPGYARLRLVAFSKNARLNQLNDVNQAGDQSGRGTPRLRSWEAL